MLGSHLFNQRLDFVNGANKTFQCILKPLSLHMFS